MQRNFQKFFRVFWARAFRLARRTANFLLGAFLLLSSAVLAGILTGVSVRLPEYFDGMLRDYVYEKGFQVEYDRLGFDLLGRLSAKSPKLRFLGTSSNFFEADAVSVRLDTSRLLFGELKVLELSVNGARLAPSTGAADNVWTLENVSFRVFSEGGDYDIKNAFAKFGKIYFSMSGRFPKSEIFNGGEILRSSIDFTAFDFLKGEAEGGSENADEPPQTLPQKWDYVCRQFEKMHPYASSLADPALLFTFNLDRRDGLRFFLQASADGIDLKGNSGPQFSSKDIFLACRYNSARKADEFNISLKVRAPQWHKDVSVESVNLHAAFNSVSKKFVDAKVTFLNAAYGGMRADYIWLGRDEIAIDKPDIGADFCVNSDGHSLLGRVFADGDLLKADFEGSISLREIFQSGLLPDVPELKMFEFRQGLYLTGNLEMGMKKPEDLKASAAVSMADANFFGVEAEWLFGDLSYDGESGDFWARDTYVKSREGWTIGGDVYQNLKNLDYRFLLRGALRPMAIAHFMEPWWAEIFTDTTFEGDFPLADFSVIGRWLRPEQIYVYGSIYADDAMRHGVSFDHVDLLVWTNPERIALMDVNVRNEDRWARANLDWVYFSKQLDSFDENRIYAVSTLNKRELVGMGGPKVGEALEILDFDNPPEVSIKLFMPNPEKYPKAKDKINLDYFARGATRVSKIALEDFRFRGYLDGDDIWLDNMHFSIAKGAGSGEIFLTKRDGKDWMRLSARLEGARQDEFLEFLASLGDEPPAPGKKVGLGEFDKFGVVSGRVSLAGFPDEPETLEGGGEAFVRNPKLAEVNLLGIISRAASAIGFPIASFDLKEAASPFEISDGTADFSDIVISGPTARINARARYDFMNDQLYASGIMSPFAAMDPSLFSAVMKLVNPFMSVLEVGMKGPIGDPDVSVSLKPFNLFRSDESIGRNIDRKLDREEERQRSSNGAGNGRAN